MSSQTAEPEEKIYMQRGSCRKPVDAASFRSYPRECSRLDELISVVLMDYYWVVVMHGVEDANGINLVC
jgi:hypothetical protein